MKTTHLIKRLLNIEIKLDFIGLCVIFLLCLNSCEKDFVKPQAIIGIEDFNIYKNQNFIDVPVTFSNLSTNADSYLWDFGDGNFSTDLNPKHYYLNPGTYFVILEAQNSKATDTDTMEIKVLPSRSFLLTNNSKKIWQLTEKIVNFVKAPPEQSDINNFAVFTTEKLYLYPAFPTEGISYLEYDWRFEGIDNIIYKRIRQGSWSMYDFLLTADSLIMRMTSGFRLTYHSFQ